MAKSGPKPRNARNRRRDPAPATSGLWAGWKLDANEPPEVAAQFWRLAGSVASIGTKDRIDPSYVLAAARLLATTDDAWAEVIKNGLVQEACNGTPMPNPAIAIIHKSSTILRGMFNDMGLTARSSKLATGSATAEESPWAGLLGVVGSE